MSEEMISRDRAGTVRLACQVAAGALAVAATMLVLVGLPFGGSGEVESVAYEELATEAAVKSQSIRQARQLERQATASQPADYEAIEYSLQMVRNAPQPKETDPAPVEEPETPVVPQQAGGRTRFLGTVQIGDRMLALLSAGGSQRILGPGDTARLALAPGDQGEPPRVEVKGVSPESVHLVENGTDRKVERSERAGLAMSQGSSPSPESSPEKPESASGSRPVEADRPINPDDFRREDGTIDYESLREAARARARARQDVRRVFEEDGQD